MTFLKEPSCPGESKKTAIRRLNSLRRKLEANPNLQQLYRNFIHEYLDMGHMEQMFEVSEPKVAYYLPHHGVPIPNPHRLGLFSMRPVLLRLASR
ncbi:hypothetical protein AVEN_83461-1 [Araneus ventricosus]|uniref:Uncharacterized protein n=1 Tax=Araneus ventricosus TaxID=182803 RepID=A0A4Y2JNB1_ARAVE|nr:hypothetical protein AVEN_83461-1 [Araneus ventricosus]